MRDENGVLLVESSEEQLDLWVEGTSTHLNPRRDCCPDFSCCFPLLQRPAPERLEYRRSGMNERGNFLGRYLTALIAHKNLKNAQVVGP